MHKIFMLMRVTLTHEKSSLVYVKIYRKEDEEDYEFNAKISFQKILLPGPPLGPLFAW